MTLASLSLKILFGSYLLLFGSVDSKILYKIKGIDIDS